MSIKSRHIKKIVGRNGKVLIIKLVPLPELPKDVYSVISEKFEFKETWFAFRLSCKRARDACGDYKKMRFITTTIPQEQSRSCDCYKFPLRDFPFRFHCREMEIKRQQRKQLERHLSVLIKSFRDVKPVQQKFSHQRKVLPPPHPRRNKQYQNGRNFRY